MYYEHFGLSGPPFEFSPSASALFMSAGHREGLAALEWGLSEPSGFTMLVGEIGAGKTTLIYSLLATRRKDVRIAWVANPRLSFEEILRQILGQLGAELSESSGKLALLQAFDAKLASLGPDECVAVIVDEAQDLSDDALEDLRLLSNFQSLERRRLQVVLVGQINLARRLAGPRLRQLNQRIGARALLPTLQGKEIHDYVDYRLRSRGGDIEKLFTSGAIKEIARESGGIPRRINVLCHNALLQAYAQNEERVTALHVRDAAYDFDHLLLSRASTPAKMTASASAAMQSASDAMRRAAARLGRTATASARWETGSVAAKLVRTGATAGTLSALLLLGVAVVLVSGLRPLQNKSSALAALFASQTTRLASAITIGWFPVQFKAAPHPTAKPPSVEVSPPRNVEVSPIVVHDGRLSEGSAASEKELKELNKLILRSVAESSSATSATPPTETTPERNWTARPHAMPIQIRPVRIAPVDEWSSAENIQANPAEASMQEISMQETPAIETSTVKVDGEVARPAATVVVRAGDTLSTIAMRLYGSFGTGELSRLTAANPEIKDANLIYPGQSIRVNQTSK